VSLAYIDASALVKLIAEEDESEALALFLGSAGPLASSILVTVEVARAVSRVAPDRDDRTTQVVDGVSLIEFNARIAARAAVVRPPTLRTLDAIHLASAMELGDDLTAFVCYDERLSAAARELGLPVVSPTN
jgi:predicted nucleic acid-binding protein